MEAPKAVELQRPRSMQTLVRFVGARIDRYGPALDADSCSAPRERGARPDGILLVNWPASRRGISRQARPPKELVGQLVGLYELVGLPPAGKLRAASASAAITCDLQQ